MASELRRSFKQKAKAAFALPFRLRRGLDPVTGDDNMSGTMDTGGDDQFQAAAMRSNSFDVAPSGYIAPTVAWFTGLLLPEFEGQQRCAGGDVPEPNNKSNVDVDSASSLQQPQSSMDESGTSCGGDGSTKRRKTPIATLVPKGTLPYVVTSTDTLASIAAQFDTTTSELKKCNRLMSDVVFAGKTMYVPDRDYIWSESSSSTDSRPGSPTAVGDPAQTGSSVVADETTTMAEDKHIDALSMLKLAGYPDMLLMRMKPIFSGNVTQSRMKKQDEDWHEQFFKLNVTHVVDQHDSSAAVVPGVLMVTPQAIMFEPTIGCVAPAPSADDPPVDHAAEAAGDGNVASATMGEDTATETRPDEDEDLQKHRMIVPLDIVTSITISDSLSTQTVNQSRDPVDDDVFCSKSDAVTVRPTMIDTPSKFYSETYQDVETAVAVTSTTSIANLDRQNRRHHRLDDDGDDVDGGNTADLEPNDKDCRRVVTASKTCKLSALSTDVEDQSMDEEKRLEENDVTYSVMPSLPSGCVRVDTGNASLSTSPPTGNMLLSARRLPKAAVALLRFPYDSIRRELDSTGNSSADDSSSPAAAETPPLPSQLTSSSPSSARVDLSTVATASRDGLSPPVAVAQQGGLMSRTLGSISSLPSSLVDLSSSLFVRGGSSDGGGPSPPRSALLEKTAAAAAPGAVGAIGERSPGPSQSSTRTFLFQPLERFVRGSKTGPGDVDTADGSAISSDDVETAKTDESSQQLYMCIKVGKMFNIVAGPADTFIRVRLKPEYWFIISPERVDDMYEFFMNWSPSVPGTDDEVGLTDRGFIAMEASPGGALHGDDFSGSGAAATAGCTRPSSKQWQFVNVKEVRRLISMAEVKNLPLPELSTPSQILANRHIRQLCYNLPARAEGCPWYLIYSSDKHGFSLHTLYRCMSRTDAPSLLVIKDDAHQIFGAMLPCSLKQSDAFYGTGESYLFTFYQGFKKYSWTGRNTFFIKGNADSLSFGAGEGANGLWLDGDLYHGRTQCCLTFENDLLTSCEDFVIQCLEVWGFS